MKISILVPVYGVAQYIEACAISLFEQSYTDLEYIFVDDCTPDNSMEVLAEVVSRYPLRQQQVRIIHHEHNRGLGAARATALEAATGEFVMVVDSDDVLPLDAVAILWQRQQETAADMIDGAFCQLRGQDLTAPILPYHGSQDSMLRLMLIQNTVSHQLWGRLVRRSIYTDNDINSIEGVNMAEDYAVTPRLLYCSTRAYTDEVVYYYRLNESSTFAEHLTEKHMKSYLRAHQAVVSFLQSRGVLHSYRIPLGIGMLRVWYAAWQTGMDTQEIAETCGYQLPNLFLACRKSPGRTLLRWTYLVSKRLYIIGVRIFF